MSKRNQKAKQFWHEFYQPTTKKKWEAKILFTVKSRIYVSIKWINKKQSIKCDTIADGTTFIQYKRITTNKTQFKWLTAIKSNKSLNIKKELRRSKRKQSSEAVLCECPKILCFSDSLA